MGFDFRYPNITGTTEREQLTQVKGYLIQLVDQLQWAMNNISSQSPTAYSAQTVPASRLSTSASQVSFNTLKPLIIKSAEIVEAYYEEINKRLQGLYVAQSDFGTFQEQTSQEIKSTSQSVTQAFTSIQSIETNLQEAKSDIGSNIVSLFNEVGSLDTDLQGVKAGVDTNLQGLTNEVGRLDTAIDDAKNGISADLQELRKVIDIINYSLVEVSAYIRSGVLYYDDNETPVYGVEIGQTNVIDGEKVFNKFARYTSDRLSFYDQNGTEVAYISDYKIHITHAEVIEALKLGGYLIDASRGLTVKWVGRS